MAAISKINITNGISTSLVLLLKRKPNKSFKNCIADPLLNHAVFLVTAADIPIEQALPDSKFAVRSLLASLCSGDCMKTQNRSSNRSFGLMWVTILTAVSLFPLLSNGNVRWWSLWLALPICAIALLRPSALATPNAVWFRFSEKLQSITSPIILGVLYFGMITPVAWIFRACGRKPMPLGFDRAARTYWNEQSASEHSDCDFTKPF
jgi:hypothetical protein